ncbi:B12-binding domain-containing radical SAM protein [Spirosoma foliorum]|uniref:B12-binding domain-containing radical SAM protein n=1 Tax=Spirosoma foliorum TaxID=2710596 RepID=A0A7G5H628_9BACT|nr:radical SAM protein [Spirosoma foliorum]QMW06570.1 B12-binding domain-containing radical SAM protein [Spirosoma foliorum]
MKRKVLLTNTYFYRFDKKQWKAQKPYPPYGTILAAAILRKAGYDVSLFDTNLAKSTAEIDPYLTNTKPDYLVIFDDNFNYLSKMCLTVMREACFDLIRYGKAAGCQIIVNSSDATDHYEKYLQAGADVVLLGESEQMLQTVLGRDLANLGELKGVAFMKDQYVVHIPKGASLPALDEYPTPAWDLVRLSDYEKIWQQSHGYFSLNIATTRGCPFKCNWCAKPIYGKRYNSRSPQKVADELSYLVSQGASHFWVCDDIFGLKPGWVKEFRQIIKERKLNLKLKIQSRADLLVKEDTIQDLIDVGLDEVWIGAESGSQKILDAMDKGITIAEIEQATQGLQQRGVKVAFFLQYGYLGEQWEDIQKTLTMVKRLLPDDIGISVSYPLPGTGFYEKVKAQLQRKQNWEDSDDLAMLYKATFSAKFYRRLHEYTHRVYRKEKAVRGWQKSSAKALLKLPYLWARERLSFQGVKLLLP